MNHNKDHVILIITYTKDKIKQLVHKYNIGPTMKLIKKSVQLVATGVKEGILHKLN